MDQRSEALKKFVQTVKENVKANNEDLVRLFEAEGKKLKRLQCAMNKIDI